LYNNLFEIEFGNVAAALEVLRQEIAKLEAGRGWWNNLFSIF